MPLGKQKSMQVGPTTYNSRNSHHNGFANDGVGMLGTQHSHGGFKMPDSSFTFQPHHHNTTMQFGAGATGPFT